MSAQLLLEAYGLTVRFGARRAVDGLDVGLAPGETVGLVGESGCGKTSTALALMGLLPAAARVSGALHWRGAPLPGTERGWRRLRGRELAMVFQDPAAALNPVRPIGAQMASTLDRALDLGRRAARAHVRELLEEVGLPCDEDFCRRYPHQLSGGQCQRVLIATALGCRPALVIADEPTSALDVTTQAQVLEALTTLARRRGTALLLISHDLGVVAGCCDRVLVMYCGRVVEAAPAPALFRSPMHPYSAGLLRAVPRLDDPPRTPLAAIPGRPPEPDAMPPGCAFQPRCPRADRTCLERVPALAEAHRGERRAACFHPMPDPGDER